MSETALTHTDSVTELAPRPDGRHRWRWRGRTFVEVAIPEGDADASDSEGDVDAGIIVAKFKATIAPLQADALDAILQEVPAAEYARRRRIDGSVARRRFTRTRKLFGKWLRTAGLTQD